MYSVFLVDDEPIVLEGIRNKINWEQEGFTFAGEATDGELALSMIHEIKPDILITDIKMPFMDGLELASAVKKLQPWIKIIILSGHDEFDYAKKAISIGIEEYILKPFTAEELLGSMNKAANQIEKERIQISDMSKIKEELKSKEQLIKQKFLEDILKGNVDTKTFMQRNTELKIKLFARFYKVLISEIKSKDNSKQALQESSSRLLSYSNWENTESFFIEQNKFVCIITGNTKGEIEENCYNIAESIEHIVCQNPNCNVLTSIGKTIDHLSQISNSYLDAEKIIEMCNFENQNRILNSDDIEQTKDGLLALKETDPHVDRLKYASKNEISLIIEESLELVKSNPGQFRVFASYLLVDLIMEVSNLVETLGGNIKEIKPEILQRTFIDEAVKNEELLKSNLERILNFALEYRDSKMTGRYGDVILKAKAYIEKNYADPNTTLTTVSEAVNFSPNHFSAIFSQECKITFIEYLTNVRIEHAKELITKTDMKGYDIAYECGFSDPHYFSYIFKKNTGYSPREYRIVTSSSCQ